ncbi:MAG: C25 family cysteine peptidase [Thermodesulfovibrionales bacterium]
MLSGTGPFTVSFVTSVTDPYPSTEPIKLKNTATIYSNETTPKQADVTIIVTGLLRPLLTIQKRGDKMFVDPTAATPDDRVTYAIAYSNVGNATATAATITDVIPAGWVYVSSVVGTNCPAGTPIGNNPVTSVTWNLGDVAVNSTGICNLILRANDTQAQPYVGDNPSTNTASLQATNFTPPVTSSFTVGLTGGGMTCPGQTYYFQNEFVNVGYDGLGEIANTSAPGSGASAYYNVLLPTNGCPAYTPIAGFYMDPVLANNGTTAPITNVWYHSKTNGNPMTVRVTMYDYDPLTGSKTQLGQGIVDDTGASQDPKAFSITLTPSQAPAAGDRLYMEYDACTSSNLQNLNIHFYYDGIYTTANKKLIPTPSHFCYQGYSVVMNKTVDKTTAVPGNTLNYSITFGNNGGSDVTGAQIIDTLPTGILLSSVSATLNGAPVSCSLAGQELTCPVRSSDQTAGQQITAGFQGILVITASLENPFPSGQYELINYATLYTTQTQPITSSARTVVTTDLTILKSVDKTLLYPGDTAIFTLKVINSSGAALSVDISDVLPTDTYFSYVAGSASNGGIYTSGTHRLDWTAISVPANSSLNFTFQMAVSLTGVPLGTTYKDNTGVVSYGSQQYSNTVTVVILNSPNINITKSVSPAGPVAAGDTVTWTRSVTNNGPQSALGVIVNDPIIAYTTYKAGSLFYQSAAQTDANDSPADTSYFDAVNNRTVYEVGDLPGGATRTMSFSAVVKSPMPNGTTTLTNTATVASGNTITKQASASINVTDSPSFVLNKYAASLVASGQSATFTIYYKNTGGATATSVVVTDTLAAGLTFVSADNGGTYDNGTRVVTWNLGSVLPDGEGALHLTITPAACGTYANTATITSAQTTPLNSNTTSTVFCGLIPDKRTTTPLVTNTSNGIQATYIITVNNPTSTNATGIQITDNFPEGFTYDSSVTPVFGGTGSTRTSVVNPANGTNHPTWGTWDINAGGSVTIQFGARVDSSVPEGTYDNNVVATGLNKSVLLFDELATTADDVRVVVPVDLSVAKTVNIAEPEGTGEGAAFVYTITLTNVGVNHSFKVILEDLLPAEITYVSSTPSQGTYDNGTGIWDVGRVDRGAGATLTITAYPNDGTAGMEIQNCVYLTSSVPREASYADPDDWSCVTIKPTLVTLSGFRAYVEGGRVVVAWETVAELDTTGFYIERYSEETGSYVRLNKKLLPGLVISPAGGFYQLIDETAAPYGKHIYRLIEATSKGNLLIYGPFQVDLGGSGSGTAQIVKKFASDGTIEVTIKGNVATMVSDASTASGPGFQGTGTYSRKAREASPDTKARLAAARSEQEKTKLRKKDRKGSAIKVTVLENNVYYIDSSDIATLLNIPSQSVQQMIKNGLLAFTTRDGQASYMPAKDNAGIFFYGTAAEGVYTKENIYWLKNDKGLLMASVEGGKEVLSGTANDSFIETLHLEQELMPAPVMTTDPNSDYWFWDYVIADFSPYDSKDFSFEASSVSTSANTANVKLKIMSIAPERSHALISLNGTLVAEETWYGIDPHSFSVNVDQKLLKEGDNKLTVKAVLDKDVYFSFLVIDSFDIEYARRFEAVSDLLSFKSEGSPSISVKGFSVPDITVFDISDTLKPKLVTSTSISGQAGNYAVKFYPAANNASYIAFASPSVKEAEGIADLPSDLKRKDNAADYIVITPEELKDGAASLADYRKSKGLTAKVVLLEDIMDEFNFGLYNPNAVKDFLQYAYSNWKKKPHYAVLVGSGTYDYKNAMGFGGNLMPPLMVGTIWGLVPSDSILGDFTGDNVPEIVAGRIPVLTPAELQTGIDKIKSFESNRPDGFMMLADSPDGGGDFSKDSDDIAQLLTGYPLQKIYLSDYKLAQARDLVFKGLNSGVAYVNYMGHAGIDQLSQGGLLTGYDAALMNNSRYPVLTVMSCMAGHYAYPGYESLSELLLVKNKGGIVSAWAPSDFSYNADAKVLGEGFYKAVLQPDVLTIGEAVVRSMGAYRAKGRASYELNIFNLLGDPALRIK